MKLQTQFTVPNKELKDLDYVKKVDFLEENLKIQIKIYLLLKNSYFLISNCNKPSNLLDLDNLYILCLKFLLRNLLSLHNQDLLILFLEP